MQTLGLAAAKKQLFMLMFVDIYIHHLSAKESLKKGQFSPHQGAQPVELCAEGGAETLLKMGFWSSLGDNGLGNSEKQPCN